MDTLEPSKFEIELTSLINKHSLENGSNTPDFILAHFLLNCLVAGNYLVDRREQWYGREHKKPELFYIDKPKQAEPKPENIADRCCNTCGQKWSNHDDRKCNPKQKCKHRNLSGIPPICLDCGHKFSKQAETKYCENFKHGTAHSKTGVCIECGLPFIETKPIKPQPPELPEKFKDCFQMSVERITINEIIDYLSKTRSE